MLILRNNLQLYTMLHNKKNSEIPRFYYNLSAKTESEMEWADEYIRMF